MKPVRILVDSTVDLPERCRAQVRAVPLTVHFGDEELIDGGHSGGLCQRI